MPFGSPGHAGQIEPACRTAETCGEAAYAYVRRTYGVPAQRGRRVTVNGRPGVIAEDRGHHIGVNFDDAKPGAIVSAHPTSEVQYLGMGPVRAPSRSQLRYQRWRSASICFDTFRDFLIHDSRRKRSP